MTKPHIYFWGQRVWVSRNGVESYRQGITLNDTSYGSFHTAAWVANEKWHFDKWKTSQLRKAVWGP